MVKANYEEILKNNGYRITIPRVKIIKEITNYPQSAKEIHDNLDDKKIDLVTVYRTLELLTSLNLISRIVLDQNAIKYESLNKDDHHHHLICDQCGKIVDADVKDKKILELIRRDNDFTIRSHSLEVWGLCAKCNAKN